MHDCALRTMKSVMGFFLDYITCSSPDGQEIQKKYAQLIKLSQGFLSTEKATLIHTNSLSSK